MPPGRYPVRAPQISFPQLVQDFFVRRLVQQRGASARTIESYRDAFELLLGFTEQRTGKPPSALEVADLDAPLVLDFLDHLQADRGNSARTRNARLAAIHSFMRYAALRDPASLPVTQRVLAIPAKRFDRPVLGEPVLEPVELVVQIDAVDEDGGGADVPGGGDGAGAAEADVERRAERSLAPSVDDEAADMPPPGDRQGGRAAAAAVREAAPKIRFET